MERHGHCCEKVSRECCLSRFRGPHSAYPLTGPLTSELVSGGRSSLTYVVADGTSRWIVRRPPMSGLTPSAHDVAREWRVAQALQYSAVPVPPAVALCEDLTVIGAPFAVHGDYRIDSTLVDSTDISKVLAVVDWELATVGDVLTDIALMCVYRQPQLDPILGLDAAWASDRLPDGDAIAEAYARRRGVDLDHWPFYLALANFKLAVIAQGITYRAADPSSTQAEQAVPALLAAGLRALGRA